MSTARSTERTRIVTGLVAAVTLGATVAGCSTDDGRQLDPPVFPPPATTVPVATLPGSEPTAPVAAPLRLVAPWRDGAPVPIRHTCDGDDLSPALTWSDVPLDAVELAVTVTDLDAPQFVHWVVLGISVDTTGMAEGTTPDGAFAWPNGSGSAEYAGPCPPPGEEHRYLFTVHALNQQLEPADEMDAIELIDILNLTSIDQSSVSGTYVRTG